MQQGPGYTPPGPGYGAPGAYPPPGAPGMGVPPPPPRRGWPWWAWLLSGCGGCVVICAIGFAVMVGVFMKRINAMGPITPQAMQQKLGDIPLYKNGTIDDTTTRTAAAGASFFTGMMKRNGGDIVAMVAMRTNDTPEQIFSFYDRTMARHHWARIQGTESGFVTQHQYRRGPDVALIQVQTQMGAQIVTLMRMKVGGPGGSSPAPVPTSPNLQPAH